MTWSDFYLICFAVGFCFSFFSFVFGSSRFGKLHLPHFHGHGVGHAPTLHGPVDHGPVSGDHAAAHGPAAAQAHGGAHAPLPRFWRGLAGPVTCLRASRLCGWGCHCCWQSLPV
jgi:hypothetical protein